MARTIEPDIAINHDFGPTIRRPAVREAGSTGGEKFSRPAPVHQQQAGYYIGSALVEKTVDLLVFRRQKLRGQNWSRTGADRPLCWRQLILNDQWDDYWQQPEAA